MLIQQTMSFIVGYLLSTVSVMIIWSTTHQACWMHIFFFSNKNFAGCYFQFEIYEVCVSGAVYSFWFYAMALRYPKSYKMSFEFIYKMCCYCWQNFELTYRIFLTFYNKYTIMVGLHYTNDLSTYLLLFFLIKWSYT